MDYELILKMIFGVVGGLGIFLLGMKNMSEGMQAVAGDRLRKMIGVITGNRFVACGVGTFITCVIQSSSVTTVMAVGMVNAGLMTLMQATGVILGANIGTTITGWILALKVGKYGLPILGVSALFYLFSKMDRMRFTASVFMGLGMVFFGLELMKHGFSPLRDMPAFLEWFSKFAPESYIGVIKCCLVGAILTAIVQSSSATLGITMGLASTGVIGFETAAALVLGENIGTTITAFLASIGANRNAKRASMSHIMINVLGVLIITLIFPIYIKFIYMIVGTNPNEVVYSDTGTSYPNVEQAIAMTHTCFNVANAFLWLPLMGFLVKLVSKIYPGADVIEEPHLKFIDVRILDTPALSIEQSRKEVLWMGNVVNEMLDILRELVRTESRDPEKEEQVFKRERKLDIVQKEVVEFLGKLAAGNISHDVMDRVRKQLRMADEYESISDYIAAILKLRLKMRDTKQHMSDEGRRNIVDLHDRVRKYIDLINNAAQNGKAAFFEEAQDGGTAITRVMKDHRSSHLQRVENGEVTPLKSLIYMDMLNDYRKIKDHAFNIAEIVAGEK